MKILKRFLVFLFLLTILTACKKPQQYPTESDSQLPPSAIYGLHHIKVMTWFWENWDEDIEKDGFKVTIDFLDRNNKRIEFSNHSCRARIKLFAYQKTPWYRSEKRRQVYSKMHYFNSSIVSSISNSPLKIWNYEIEINPETDYMYGDCEVTVYTPKQGEFFDSYEYCLLYP